MKLHERHLPVNQAKIELAEFLEAWEERNELTVAERFSILCDEMAAYWHMWVKCEREEKSKKGKIV